MKSVASQLLSEIKSAQIFVSSVNKNPIRYTFRDATKSYTV